MGFLYYRETMDVSSSYVRHHEKERQQSVQDPWWCQRLAAIQGNF